jgi:hypothetical protein
LVAVVAVGELAVGANFGEWVDADYNFAGAVVGFVVTVGRCIVGAVDFC